MTLSFWFTSATVLDSWDLCHGEVVFSIVLVSFGQLDTN